MVDHALQTMARCHPRLSDVAGWGMTVLALTRTVPRAPTVETPRREAAVGSDMVPG